MTFTHPQEESSVDTMLEALSSRSRRQLLVNLMRKNPPQEAKQVDELDVEGDKQRFLTRLHHVDLPKLEELGYIEWDPESGEIVKGPEFDEIRPLLELMVRHQDELLDQRL